ncbi:hypothetical protein [Azohydromonas australica]|uniref:hypothetical protein n=1 Tax=Azohydromonas australica TaxID=364039 RepID=UPI0003FAB9DB|nr:hypothetical protein [Azohydromonas australica]
MSTAHAKAAAPPDTAQLDISIFLATELMYFSNLFAADTWGHTHRSEDFSVASRHTHMVLGTLNTAALLTLLLLSLDCA